MTTHEVLVEARNLLVREGWIQGALTRGGAVCAWGATRNAARDLDVSRETRNAARDLDVSRDEEDLADEAVAAAIGCHYSQIPDWNDVPGRTKEEVIAAFDKAIAATAPKPDTSFLSEPTRDLIPA